MLGFLWLGRFSVVVGVWVFGPSEYLSRSCERGVISQLFFFFFLFLGEFDIEGR